MLTTLISNICKLTKDGKESYFGKRWGAVAGLQKQIDRKDYQFSDIDKCSPATTLSRLIIDRYENRELPADVCLFVGRMRNESLEFVAEQRGMRMAQIERLAYLNAAGAELVVRMYDFLSKCATELNASMGFSELTLVSTPPLHVTETVSFSRSRHPLETVTYFRARLGTPRFSLVMRAKEDTIEFYILPAAAVIGLSISEKRYECAARLHAAVEAEKLTWCLDGKPLTPYRELEICMVLFRKLLEQTKAQMATESSAS